MALRVDIYTFIPDLMHILSGFLLYIHYISAAIFRFLQNFPWIGPFADTFSLYLVSAIRLGSGCRAATDTEKCQRPKTHLILYDREADRKCAIVRETLSLLDLNHQVYPCPYGMRPPIVKGFCPNPLVLPTLLDDSNVIEGKQAVCQYLFEKYGKMAHTQWNSKLARVSLYDTLSGIITTFLRPQNDMGYIYLCSKIPDKPLELHGYEGSPDVKRVREVLCSLGIPYVSYVLPFGSNVKRKNFLTRHSESISFWKRQISFISVPYLVDPNKSVHLFNHEKIVNYLMDTYCLDKSSERNCKEASLSICDYLECSS